MRLIECEFCNEAIDVLTGVPFWIKDGKDCCDRCHNGSENPDKIKCNRCQKVVNVVHSCYGKNKHNKIHKLEGLNICHACWDKALGDAVKSAGW